MLQAFYGKNGGDLMLEPPLYSVSATCVTSSLGHREEIEPMASSSDPTPGTSRNRV